MASDGQIVFEVTADGKNAKANIKDITNTIEKETKKWDNAVESSTQNMTSSMARALDINRLKDWGIKAAKILLDFGKQAVDAASDLEEVQNVVDTTFGSSASVIDAWAKKAGTQFGLTETQAKKFTSTLGAMAKSAGVSGDEIVGMSTDLAGLAADMASFYNLDFDTAFQKIRSGISGETEPLKQLGINMSVANLNAYALQKGLGKTFEQMSQAEQTMLRYQYIMQATADAQGDFARTSDGYANTMRMLETNIERVKTALGQTFIGVVQNAASELNGFLNLLLPDESKRTVLDEFADIDLKTEEKLSAVQQTADKAKELTATLSGIGGQITANRTAAQHMMDDAPDGKTGKVSELKDSLAEIEETAGKAKTAAGGIDSGIKTTGTNATSYKEMVSGIGTEATTVAGKLGDIDKSVNTQKTRIGDYAALVTQVGENGKTVVEIVGKIDKGIKADQDSNLSKYGQDVNSLNSKLNTTADRTKAIDSGIPSPEGSNLSKYETKLESVKSTAEETAKATAEIPGAMSENVTYVDETNEKYDLWLETCKQLVETIPGLSSIINTETGEVRGGVDAVNAYIDAWEKAQRLDILLSANQQKQNALNTKFAELPGLELDKTVAEYRVRKAREELDALYQKYGLVGQNPDNGNIMSAGEASALGVDDEGMRAINNAVVAYQNLVDAKNEAVNAYNRQKGAYDEAATALEEERQILEDLKNETEDGTEAAEEWTTAQREAALQAAEAFNEAAKAVADYYEKVRTATKEEVNSNIKGFGMMKSAADQYEDAANKVSDLRKELEKAGKLSEKEIKIKLDAENAQITLQSMTEGLESQLKYIEEYKKNLEAARNAGVSEEILAQLSDGSNESALYLNALAQAAGDTKKIEELNNLWKEVNKEKEGFTDTLTQQKLTVDQTYQGMVKAAEDAAAKMDVSGKITESTGKNVSAIASAISAKVPEVTTAVDAILSELNRLNGWGVSIDLGSFGSFGFSLGNAIDGSFEIGLDHVPFDGFLAQLHEGEGILTAEENRVWQDFKNGGASSRNIDYDQLGGVMRDNIQAGGNVYLDGSTVGKVVSRLQGNSYRTMTRSGWQA